jgi:hypothetical protein
MKIHDDVYAWQGWGGNLHLGSGKCRLQIFDTTGKKDRQIAILRPIIVVVSDLENAKTTVRSCVSHVATCVVRDFAIDFHRMLFVEYYPEVVYGEHGQHRIAERIEAVEFTWIENKAIKPKWRLLSSPLREIVKDLLCEP